MPKWEILKLNDYSCSRGEIVKQYIADQRCPTTAKRMKQLVKFMERKG